MKPPIAKLQMSYFIKQINDLSEEIVAIKTAGTAVAIDEPHKLNAKRRTLMVNTQLFKTLKGALLPDADARNHEQAPAYALGARHQLAQLAATGCLNQTFYANAEAQLDTVRALAQSVDAAFVAKTALYAREDNSPSRSTTYRRRR